MKCMTIRCTLFSRVFWIILIFAGDGDGDVEKRGSYASTIVKLFGPRGKHTLSQLKLTVL